MSSVLILQHLVDDGPAFLGDWLAGEGVPAELRCTEAGDAFPAALGDARALAVLGGAMSANDELPSLRQAERLIIEAVDRGIPVIGHCLGGQLMARALGGLVGPSRAPEIGWLHIDRIDNAAADDWFGAAPLPPVFQWHYEAFTLPEGAQPLATSPACPLQAFALGPHLAMQFHVEQDAAKLACWVQAHEPTYPQARRDHPATVQATAAMLAEAPLRLQAQQQLAARLYRRWLAGAV
ncbi:MAG TPA: type 1 glutamine amidotransferase [Aquabacterium sp.]|nr:type 1 glutamine amidotransferase [Aquabacterium sp.]